MLRSMKPRLLALSVASAVALAVPIPAWASAPATKATVEVDVALDQPDDDALAARLRGDLVKALNAEGIAVTKSTSAGVGAIKLHVKWNADDNHEITAEVLADGDTKTPEGGPWVCDTCRETQLSAKVVELLPLVVPLLPETQEATAADGGPGDAGAGPGDDGGSGAPDPKNGGGKRKLGPMGKAGIGVLAVGVSGAVAGGVLAGMGVKRNTDGVDPQDVDVTDLRKPGIPIAVVGAALAVTGLALLAVDLSRSRKRSTTMAPVFGPRMAGIGVAGRF
jgi:hypothetical protein